MQKTVLLLLLLKSILLGYTYDELLIKAQTSLFPKILLLDKKINRKLVNGKIVYLIAHEKRDKITALRIKQIFESKYGRQLEGYPVEVKTAEYETVDEKTEATAIYVLNSQNHIPRLSRLAASKGMITFAYDTDYLRHGVLFSLMLEKSTILYISKKNIPLYNVDFVDVLYHIVRFIDAKK